MKNNNSDFISLTAAVRRAKSEGLNLSYAGLRIHSTRAQW